jgi:hypothetical protein
MREYKMDEAPPYNHIAYPAYVEIAKKPGTRTWNTTFTVGWADVKDDDGVELGSVNSKIDGSVEIFVKDSGSEWVLRLRTPELWRLAQHVIRQLEDDDA